MNNSRENFYHTCWLKLRANRSDLSETMTEVELYVAGIEKSTEQDKEEGSDSDDLVL